LLVAILYPIKLLVRIVRAIGDINLRRLMRPFADTGAQSGNGILIIDQPVTQIEVFSSGVMVLVP